MNAVRVHSLTGSHNPPPFPRMRSDTLMISGPAVEAAQILMWNYSVCSWIKCPQFSELVCFILLVQFSPVQFSHSVVCDYLQTHEWQHARLPSPLPTPGVHSNSRSSNQWCHPAISSSVVPFSSCVQSLPASESFPISQLFVWGGQSAGVSALAASLPKNTQDGSPLEWTG